MQPSSTVASLIEVFKTVDIEHGQLCQWHTSTKKTHGLASFLLASGWSKQIRGLSKINPDLRFDLGDIEIAAMKAFGRSSGGSA